MGTQGVSAWTQPEGSRYAAPSAVTLLRRWPQASALPTPEGERSPGRQATRRVVGCRAWAVGAPGCVRGCAGNISGVVPGALTA